ncbi:MAG TPA: bifunctional nuclease family protein [Blastocatellia bacterium]|nr:bifunctional nuclease family protein [Blastocatellia bacterium]HMX25892.1 bifunctional nuclease family protein [Blastocatellia bacterium]HMZ19006.1 bifunctional nuclease family protein [Blastocatellia bacterium]HNG28306.1 bifunctional nuclease family protein [Blastocatellia bacterium]
MDREVKIRGLLVDPTTNSPVVLLKDIASDDVMLPIWVGPYEANSIASEIEKLSSHRPMTHDLLRNVIAQMGGVVTRVTVTDLRDSTFYAVIEIVAGGQTVLIDARPSDAIALALRVDCPIYVRETVLESSRLNNLEKMVDEEDDFDEEVEWPEEIEDIGGYKM